MTYVMRIADTMFARYDMGKLAIGTIKIKSNINNHNYLKTKKIKL